MSFRQPASDEDQVSLTRSITSAQSAPLQLHCVATELKSTLLQAGVAVPSAPHRSVSSAARLSLLWDSALASASLSVSAAFISLIACAIASLVPPTLRLSKSSTRIM